MDFNALSGMKVDELKVFLRPRGMKTCSHKEVLVARAFIALKNNVPIMQCAV